MPCVLLVMVVDGQVVNVLTEQVSESIFKCKYEKSANRKGEC